MCAELPPDVRDRAAQAAKDAYRPYRSNVWRAVVDAVAEVLAARYEIDRRAWSGAVSKASVDAYRQGRLDENDALKARVDLLATALTELVALYDGTHPMFATIPRSIATGPITKVFEDAHDRARAALSATPTETEAL